MGLVRFLTLLKGELTMSIKDVIYKKIIFHIINDNSFLYKQAIKEYVLHKTLSLVQKSIQDKNMSSIVLDYDWQIYNVVKNKHILDQTNIQILNFTQQLNPKAKNEEFIGYNPFNYIHNNLEIKKAIDNIIIRKDSVNDVCEKILLEKIFQNMMQEPISKRNFTFVLDILNDWKKHGMPRFDWGFGREKHDVFDVLDFITVNNLIEDIKIFYDDKIEFVHKEKLEIDMLRKEKTTLFVEISSEDNTYDAIIRILIQQLWQELALNQYDNYGNDEFPHFVRMITPLFEETTANIRDGLLPTYEQLFRWAHFTRRPEAYNLDISVVSMYDNTF